MASPTRSGLVLVLALVATACGGGGDVAQSTAPTSSTVTTAPPTTAAPPTTTTTTAPPTTTSTAPPTTTTTAGPAQPALAATGYAVLGWRDGGWVSTPAPPDLPAGVEGSTFDVVTLDGASTAVAASVTGCETTGTAILEFDPPLPGERRVSGAVALLDPAWDPVPRPVTVGDPPAERLEAALDHLAGQGIEETGPPFVQDVEADLDGDGAVEAVLAVARGEQLAGPGDYSLVMLFAGGEPVVVAESYGTAESPYVLNHVIAAVADLDGDGSMEVVLDTSYYEGSGSVALAYDPAGPALDEVMSGGCGA